MEKRESEREASAFHTESDSIRKGRRERRATPERDRRGLAEEEEEEKMAWWNKKVVFPVKRAWVAVAARVKARKSGDGILKLHDDVRMCGYQDVQVMWEMLRSELEVSHTPKHGKQYGWRPSILLRSHRCHRHRD